MLELLMEGGDFVFMELMLIMMLMVRLMPSNDEERAWDTYPTIGAYEVVKFLQATLLS